MEYILQYATIREEESPGIFAELQNYYDDLTEEEKNEMPNPIATIMENKWFNIAESILTGENKCKQFKNYIHFLDEFPKATQDPSKALEQNLTVTASVNEIGNVSAGEEDFEPSVNKEYTERELSVSKGETASEVDEDDEKYENDEFEDDIDVASLDGIENISAGDADSDYEDDEFEEYNEDAAFVNDGGNVPADEKGAGDSSLYQS